MVLAHVEKGYLQYTIEPLFLYGFDTS